MSTKLDQELAFVFRVTLTLSHPRAAPPKATANAMLATVGPTATCARYVLSTTTKRDQEPGHVFRVARAQTHPRAAPLKTTACAKLGSIENMLILRDFLL